MLGYDYTIKSDYMKSNFTVYLQFEVSYASVNRDDFLPVYYIEKYNYSNYNEFEEYIVNDIKNKYSDVYKIEGITEGSVYEIQNRNVIIPKNYGKVPTIEELEDLIVKHYKLVVKEY